MALGGRLSEIPQLASLFADADANLEVLDGFVGKCERRLSECLVANTLPDHDLIEAIAVAKVRCVEDSIAKVFALKQEVGSYALMEDSGFGNSDFLQACKFAEGDSRILMQKMARDRMRAFAKDPATGVRFHRRVAWSRGPTPNSSPGR